MADKVHPNLNLVTSEISRMDENDLNEMLDSIDIFMKCPICGEQLCSPLKMCGSGHVTCKECRELASSCSLCQQPLFPLPRSFQDLLDILPKKCMNHLSGGCKQYSLSGRHEKVCKFRTIDCVLGRDNECSWNGTVNNWLIHKKEQKHLRDTFEKQFVIYNVSDIKVQIFCMEKNEDNVFIFVSCNEDEISISARLLVLNKVTKKYYLMMKILKSTEQDYPLYFPVKVIDMDNPKNIDNTVDCVKFPIETLISSMNCYDEILVDVTLFEKT